VNFCFLQSSNHWVFGAIVFLPMSVCLSACEFVCLSVCMCVCLCVMWIFTECEVVCVCGIWSVFKLTNCGRNSVFYVGVVVVVVRSLWLLFQNFYFWLYLLSEVSAYKISTPSCRVCFSWLSAGNICLHSSLARRRVGFNVWIRNIVCN